MILTAAGRRGWRAGGYGTGETGIGPGLFAAMIRETASKPMHILYVSQYFPPEVGAGSARAFELAKHWARAGHRVTALTGFPSYPTGWNGNGNGAHPPPDGAALWEREDRLRVIRSWAMSVGSRTPRERLMAWLSFSLSSSLRGIAVPEPDVVVASSPPLTVGATGWWLSRVKRKPFVFDVRDLWPESVRDLAGTRPGAVTDRTLDAMAGFLYRSADRVVVTSEATRRALLAGGKTGTDATLTIPNGVETEMFAPPSPSGDGGRGLKESLGLAGKFVVSFIGTIGLAQDLDLVAQAAARLAEGASLPGNRESGGGEPHFLLVGEGPRRQRLVQLAREMGLPNFTFLPAQPRERIPAFIHASDVCLVTLRPAPVNDVIIPFRMLEFMSCARPVLLGAAGEAARIMDAAGAGLVVPQGNAAALAEAILRLRDDPELRRRLGENGRQYIARHFSREQLARDYLQALQETVAASAAV